MSTDTCVQRINPGGSGSCIILMCTNTITFLKRPFPPIPFQRDDVDEIPSRCTQMVMGGRPEFHLAVEGFAQWLNYLIYRVQVAVRPAAPFIRLGREEKCVLLTKW